MRLLVTNDDGIHAKGIQTLIKELEKHHEVWVVAPHEQRSACSHSITLSRPLTVKEVALEGIKSKAFCVDGTPADCVRIALGKLVEEKVDMVVSGINRGYNLGTDILYSGTVSAAIEAAINKIPSVAMSMDITDEEADYAVAAKYATFLLEKAKENHIQNDLVLNVNVPLLSENEIKGIKICKIGSRVYHNKFIEIHLEDQGKGYEISGELKEEESKDTDVSFIKEGYITVTPLHYDLTNFHILQDVNGWFRS